MSDEKVDQYRRGQISGGQVVPLQTARGQMENPSCSQDRATSSEPLVKMIPVPPPQLTQDELAALSRRADPIAW